MRTLTTSLCPMGIVIWGTVQAYYVSCHYMQCAVGGPLITDLQSCINHPSPYLEPRIMPRTIFAWIIYHIPPPPPGIAYPLLRAFPDHPSAPADTPKGARTEGCKVHKHGNMQTIHLQKIIQTTPGHIV